MHVVGPEVEFWQTIATAQFKMIPMAQGLLLLVDLS